MYWTATDDNIKAYDNSWWYRPVTADIETTAYGLLTALIMANQTERLKNGLAITQWLSKQRNANGGFESTQVRESIRNKKSKLAS